MKPSPFEYERPASVEEALSALARGGDDAKVLAGGQSLIPMLNLRMVRTGRLIDIGRIEALRRIEEVDGELRIGATATHNAILTSPLVAETCPLITEAYHDVSHHSVRNHGTLGGSLCHNDPAAEMPLVMSILGATLVVRKAGKERAIKADDFFRDSFTTALEPDELLVEIRVPIPPKGHGYSFQELAQRKGDFALVACAAMLTIKGGVCRDVRIGCRNAGGPTMRSAASEASLEGAAPTPGLIAEIAAAAAEAADPNTDVHADVAYRRDLIRSLLRRALTTAVERASRS